MRAAYNTTVLLYRGQDGYFSGIPYGEYACRWVPRDEIQTVWMDFAILRGYFTTETDELIAGSFDTDGSIHTQDVYYSDVAVFAALELGPYLVVQIDFVTPTVGTPYYRGWVIDNILA